MASTSTTSLFSQGSNRYLYSGMYDSALMGILLSEKKIVPFLDVVFRFLYNHTDFYVGFELGNAEAIVMSAFKMYEKLAKQRVKQTSNTASSVISEKAIKIEPEDDIIEVTPVILKPQTQNVQTSRNTPSSTRDLQQNVNGQTSILKNVGDAEKSSTSNRHSTFSDFVQSQLNANKQTTTSVKQIQTSGLKNVGNIEKSQTPSRHLYPRGILKNFQNTYKTPCYQPQQIVNEQMDNDKQLQASISKNFGNIGRSNTSQPNVKKRTVASNLRSQNNRKNVEKPSLRKDWSESSPQRRVEFCHHFSSSEIRDRNYSWTQTSTEIDVSIPVPRKCVLKGQVSVNITETLFNVNVHCRNIIKAFFYDKVCTKNCRWSFEPGESINVKLGKVNDKWWPALLIRNKKSKNHGHLIKGPRKKVKVRRNYSLRNRDTLPPSPMPKST